MKKASPKAIHICNSHEPTLQPKIAKEYVFASAFLPTLKTIFFGNSSVSIEQIYNCKRLIINQ